jgi:translation initiation factor 2B subunit (eIF-2B alpha/beta/delta family)
MDREAWQGIHEAASDRLSGASKIVRRAAEALSALPSHDLEEAVLTLIRGQPSMAPLWRLGTEALGSKDHAEAARSFSIRVAAERDRIGRQAAALLPRLVVVHSFSSTVIAAVAGSGSEAICARSDPGGEGAATAKMLDKLGARARLVKDDAALAAVAEAGAVVVGADAVGPAGVVNKIGTLRLAVASRRHSTPCYALAGESKLLAADLPAEHPFERTPLDLFTSVITEDGPLTPSQTARLATRRTLHPSLAALLEERR